MATAKDRNKAFLGALIGAGISLLGGAISGAISNNASKKAQRRAQIAQNKSDTYEMAQNLSAGYGDQSYVDELKDRVTFRAGGKHKAADGGNFDWSGVINGASSGLNNIVGSAFAANQMKHRNINSQAFMANVPKTELVIPDYKDRYYSTLRCGGRKRR